MMKLGVIADDFTGATDIAGFLVSSGVHTIQVNGIPEQAFNAAAQAYVVSLKTRSCPKAEAVSSSLRALEWLQKQGCTHFYFKYCSTFDSTDEGNIGPVADALLEKLGEQFSIVCPSLPVNGRTVYKGKLFVHDQLLSESGMKDHPVTPMTDADLARILSPQTTGTVGNVYYETIEKGPEALKDAFTSLRGEGVRYAVVDTVNQHQLMTIGEAASDLKLFTGGSGLVTGLAPYLGSDSATAEEAQQYGKPRAGRSVIITGSCSLATNRQVAAYKKHASSHFVDVDECLHNPRYVQQLYEWTMEHVGEPYAPLLYATKSPEELKQSKARYGDVDAGKAIEEVLGKLSVMLMDAGVQNFIIAGGETAGQVVQSLELSAFHIGPQIAPGVPWVKSLHADVYLALKSGNFGGDDFFTAAQEWFV